MGLYKLTLKEYCFSYGLALVSDYSKKEARKKDNEQGKDIWENGKLVGQIWHDDIHEEHDWEGWEKTHQTIIKISEGGAS